MARRDKRNSMKMKRRRGQRAKKARLKRLAATPKKLRVQPDAPKAAKKAAPTPAEPTDQA